MIGKTIADPWYFPRRELAQSHLELLHAGGTQALTLYAERRTGKTSFLLNDIEPAAAERGLLPIYVDFWELKGDAAGALVNALATTHQALTSGHGALARLLKTPVRAVGAFSLRLDFGDDKPPALPDEPLLRIRWFLTQILAGSRRPVLLLLDEIQQVALDTEGERLVASLRSALQQLRGQVFVIFSGSSEAGLTRMFKRSKAPLYEFSSHVPFPLLDRAFIQFLCERHVVSTGRVLDEARLWQAFRTLHFQPQAIKDLVIDLIKSASQDIDAALENYLARTLPVQQAELMQMISDLKPVERLVLKALAEDRKPTAQATLKDMAEALGTARMYPNSVTHALNKLIDRELVTQWADGRYKIVSRPLWALLSEDPAALDP